MDRSSLRAAVTHWRRPADAGALVFLCWFLLLLARPQLVRGLQSFLLGHRGLLPHLPHGVATPRTVVGGLVSLGIPLAVLSLLVALVVAPPEGDGPGGPDDCPDRRRGE